MTAPRVGRDRRLTSAESAMLRRTAVRLGIQAGLIVAAIVAVLVGVTLAVVLHAEAAGTRSMLAAAVGRADEDVADAPANIWLVMHGPDGQRSTEGLPAGAADPQALARTARTGVAETHEREVGGAEYQIFTMRRGDTTVQGVLDLGPVHTDRRHLLFSLLLVGGLGLVLAAGAGAMLGVRAVQPLASALSLQRRFVADASHELRTPLTLLTTRAQLLRRHLQRGHDHQAALADAESLVRDSDNLAAVLEDLLIAADPHVEGATEEIDLRVLAGGVAAASAAEAGARGVTVRAEGGDDPVVVRGAPVALRRALTAVLDNAVRHAEQTVTVTVHATDRQAVVEVADDGPGLDPGLAPRMFDRFSSAGGSSPDGRQRRFGIGLALVGEIVARHHGEVEALAAPGGGAAFRLTFPRQVPRTHTDPTDHPNPTNATGPDRP
ncbi:HAMP domain-containing sensor histidine kinase [Actinopolymorpha sp. NPDC004070]|uniref:sensor histidine kinase n=1 Tax=Actinopolymorpha sp. NPDC004070 TaxID=3154548 RepID=UPI0033BDD096